MPTSSIVSVESAPPDFKRSEAVASGGVPLWRSVALLLIGGVVWLFFYEKPHATIPPQAGVVMHLPGYVEVGGGFVGTTVPVSEAEHLILPKDTEFVRKDYRDFPGPDDIFCGIVLSGAAQQSIHRPEVCLVAQGWNITDQEDIPIRLDSGHLLTVRNLTIKRTEMIDNKPITIVRYNMYWFVGEKVTTPYHYMRIFLSSWDRIVHNRAHRWAYVTVAAMITKDLIPNGLTPEQTKAGMIDFIKKIVPTFQKSEMPPETATATTN
jgi:hypothetical protein